MARSRKQNKSTRRRKSRGNNRSKGTTRRAKAGVVKFGKGKPSAAQSAAERERARQRRLEAALATAAAQVQAEAAIATPASDLVRLRQGDLEAQLSRASSRATVVDVATAMGTLAALGRAHDHLNRELQTALEQVRRRGDRQTALNAAARIAPLATVVLAAGTGALPAAPNVDRRNWRDIQAALETLGAHQGLRRDRNTGQWRATRPHESPLRTDANPFLAAATLQALLASPPPGPFVGFRGFAPDEGLPESPPPSPGQGGPAFVFAPPPGGRFDF